MARILTLTLNPALDLTVSLDSLTLGAVNRSLGLTRHAAGKGLNVAQVLTDLGHSLTVSGFLGADNVEPFEALFAARGLHDAFIRVPGETRSNIKLSEHDGRVTDLNGPGVEVSEAHQAALLEQLEQLVAGQDAVVVAGSLPRGVSVSWFAELLRRLNALGVPVALDTSGEALRAGLAATPWLVKPNDEELAEACDLHDASLAALSEAAKRLRAKGVAHVLLSRGAAGVNWYGPNVALQALPPQVQVVSTVGAGDSLLAATLHGLLNGWPAEQTLSLATAVAAQAVTQLGFGIQDREQLARLQAGVTVTPLALEQ
ncbi:1-phosphofructokinase [Pseudomonas cuatrocienegasensis]|uniref:Phosphofructokinase n=1 Tax=Pseudomonas cuatrocienegasensis TaxID=543360 RepID=A0ABY1BCL3_9PSED|nr:MULTISPECIES: 1-phosphofructokinase [Pseudomonas]OEC33635.1 1-phosphofructokinase [Pseudomonas sp. 21C1]SEQ54850.1 1-phosphofructokinase [Pseudomonas cuatrocienegasensis]